MKRYINCLSIAGSDPYGGAGIQADLKTFSALGCYGSAAITALTVQNSTGVKRSVAVDAQTVYEQAAAVFDDITIDALKIGMTVNSGIIRAITRLIKAYHPATIVLDPVMVSSSGHRLLNEEAIRELKEELMPLCTLVTPNIPELEVLSGGAEGIAAARKVIEESKCTFVLVKGGHLEGQPTDCLVSANRTWDFPGRRVDTRNTHGTGCTLSSAIAAYAAQGVSMPEAVGKAKAYVEHALAAGAEINAGKGHGSMNHFFEGHELMTR